ncbi:MAG: c-type cytochrome [Solirubrobacteraceae bacterium]
MIIAAVVFWLLLGAGVIFIAVRGGPRGAREALHTQSRIGRRVRRGAILAVFSFGLLVPALVLAFNGAHKTRSAPGGLTLSASAGRGRALFAARCATCHTLHAAHTVGRVGPNLDILRPVKVTVLDAIANGRARGMGQMPALLYEGQDATDVANFVAAVEGR